MSFQEYRDRFTRQIETIDGREWVFVESGGSGPSIVMVPGMQGTGDVFYKQVLSLGDQMRMIALSYPAEPDPEKLSDGLTKFCDRKGLAKTNLLGSSIGGYWAQIFALRNSGRIETLFIANSLIDAGSIQAAGQRPEEIEAMSLEAVRDRFMGYIENYDVSNPAMAELKEIMVDQVCEGVQPPETLKSRMLTMATAIPVPVLPIPDTQIVVIDCEDDPIMGQSIRTEVRERYAGAEQHTLATGGHYPAVMNADPYTSIIRNRLLG